jgi:hypothetical protein
MAVVGSRFHPEFAANSILRNSSSLVVSLDRKCFGENRWGAGRARAEALSIRRLEGRRWQGGRLWSHKLVGMLPE